MQIQLSDIKRDEIRYKSQKDLYLALNRLYSNPDFVTVFKNYYCHSLVLELVSNLAKYDEESIEYKETVKSLNVISAFEQFLDDIKTNGAMAIQSLNDLNAIPLSEIDDE